MSFVCQLVDQPAPTARVLFDFMDADSGVTLDGSDSPSAALNLGNPEFTSSPWSIQEGFRDITLPVVFFGTIGEVESNVASLARSLSRPSNWLRWRTSAMSKTVYFRLVRDNVGALDWQSNHPTAAMDDSYRWDWPLTLTAHAFSYGELVTLPSITLGKGGAGTSPFSAELPPIQGDAPSMARIDITPTGNQSWMGYRSLVNISASDSQSAFNGAPTVAASSFPTIASPASVVSPPSGATSYASQVVQVASPGSSFVPASGPLQANPAPGQYEVFQRVFRTSTTGTFSFQAGPEFFNYPLFQPAEPWSPPDGNACASWVDCGQTTLPTGMDPSMLFDNDVLPTPYFALGCSPGDEVGGTCFIDQVVLVPTRLARGGVCTTMKMQYQGIASPSPTATLRIDGDYERIGFRLNGYFQNVAPPLITGGFPVLSPGFNNWVTFLQNTTEVNGASEDATEQVNVQISYYPRYLQLGD